MQFDFNKLANNPDQPLVTVVYIEGAAIGGTKVSKLIELTREILNLAPVWETLPKLYHEVKADFNLENQLI